jgi:hypothetical protein
MAGPESILLLSQLHHSTLAIFICFSESSS